MIGDIGIRGPPDLRRIPIPIHSATDNSLSNATHPIQIHRAVLQKLRFKILISNISVIYGPIM